MKHHAPYAMYPGVHRRPSPSAPGGLFNSSDGLAVPHPHHAHSISTSTSAVTLAPAPAAGRGVRDGLGHAGMMAGAAGYAHWDAELHQAFPAVQQGDRRIPHFPPRHTAPAVVVMDQDLGRATASAPHAAVATLAPPPPPPPPPVLSAAQKRYLRHLQQQQQQQQQHEQEQQRRSRQHGEGGDGRVGRNLHGGGVQQYVATAPKPTSPSRHRIRAETKPSTQQQQRHWPPEQKHHPGVLPPSRYADAMPVGASPRPSPVVKVPIYGTLSEAIERQQKHHHHQSQQAYPSAQVGPPPPPPPPPPTPLGVNAVPDLAPAVFEAPVSPGRRRHELISRTMPAPDGYSRCQRQEQQQQQQQQRALRDSLRGEDERGAGRQRGDAVADITMSSGFDIGGQASPKGDVTPQHRSSGAPMPLQATPAQGFMQMCGPANMPISRPVTPVMVYAPGHGYMMPIAPVMVYTPGHGYIMAYPLDNTHSVETPRSALSEVQASKARRLYDSISLSGESSIARLWHRETETRPLPAGSSPVASLSVSSCGSQSKPEEENNQSQGHLRPRASSALSVTVERGLSDRPPHNQNRQSPPAEPTLPRSQDKENDEMPCPARGRSVSSAGAAPVGHGKENTLVRAGVVGGGRKRIGGSHGSDEEKQLSGQKRGGGAIEIEKQKSFTGSYFQVSPGSFLQSSKRQRYFA